MAKFDIKSAYRNVPVHPSNRYQYFVDLALPLGLLSVPFIFNSIAEMVEWILLHSHHIPTLLHYLNDFITTSPPDSLQCTHNLAIALAVCKWLGLLLHPGKCVGPATVLVVLAIELDSACEPNCLPTCRKIVIFEVHHQLVAPA